MSIHHEQRAPIRVPKWVCILAIALGSIGLVVQAVIDAFQSVSPSMDWPTWLLQVWQMTLPTGFTMAFAAIGGCLLFARRWLTALVLYALVGCYMAFTASNSMDFVANQTVARTQAQITRQADIRDISKRQQEIAAEERKQATESLWRTYNTTKSQADREKALIEIKEVTSKPLELQPAEIHVVQSGSGGIANKWLGWSPETVQEAKAVAFPILVMIGKALGITLGFALWPPSAERWKKQLPKSSNLPRGSEIERKLSKDEAREDIIKAALAGARIESNRELADRWGVSEGCACKWLSDFRREGIIKRERRGRFMAVTAPANVVAINGNGRVHQ
jgi:dsRNA-specific ribonuclease